jgi:hypothetical protein
LADLGYGVSLIIEPERWTRPQLVVQLTELRDEVAQMARMFSNEPPGLPNPGALTAAAGVMASSEALANAILGSPLLPDSVFVLVINQIYETRNIVGYPLRAASSPPPPFPSPPKKAGSQLPKG